MIALDGALAGIVGAAATLKPDPKEAIAAPIGAVTMLWAAEEGLARGPSRHGADTITALIGGATVSGGLALAVPDERRLT